MKNFLINIILSLYVKVIPNNQDPILKSFQKEKIFENCEKLAERVGKFLYGYNHLYTKKHLRKIILNMAEDLNSLVKHLTINQTKLLKGLKFSKNHIHIRSFFAPNHTYDDNTFIALKIRYL